MVHKKHLLLLFIVLPFVTLLLGACATSAGALLDAVLSADISTGESSSRDESEEDSEDEDVDEDDEEEDQEQIGILVETEPENADVYVNAEYVGTSPYLVEADSGTYLIRVEKEGYYEEERWVTYEEGNTLILYITLEQITGFLNVEVTPRDAEIWVDGEFVYPGVTELPIGDYDLLVRSFGFESQEASFIINPRQTTSLEFELEKAPFRVSDVGFSRPAFNPNNPGSLGNTTLAFEVSAPGRGSVTIIDESGKEVWSYGFPDFVTWDQAVQWDGRDEAGAPLPDGRYTVTIDAKGNDSTERMEELLFVDIDRTIVIAYRSTWNGLSGLLFVPTAEVLPEGSFQVNAMGVGYYSAADNTLRAPFQFGARTHIASGWELDVAAAGILQSGDVFPYTLGIGIKYLVIDPSDSPAIQLGALGRLTYVGNSNSDPLANFTGLSLGAVLQLRAGPLSILLSPDIVLSPTWPTYSLASPPLDFYMWSYGRGGFLFDFGSLTLGLSAVARTRPFSLGFALNLPFALGFEAHWILPETPLAISFGLVGEYESDSNYYFMAGVGIGVLN